MDNGELSPRTWAGYKVAGVLMGAAMGKSRLMADLGPDDFAALRNKLARRYGPHGLGTAIQCIRCVCKFAFDAELIDRAIRYGPGFERHPIGKRAHGGDSEPEVGIMTYGEGACTVPAGPSPQGHRVWENIVPYDRNGAD